MKLFSLALPSYVLTHALVKSFDCANQSRAPYISIRLQN